jgi:putative NADH-flavin reductase
MKIIIVGAFGRIGKEVDSESKKRRCAMLFAAGDVKC